MKSGLKSIGAIGAIFCLYWFANPAQPDVVRIDKERLGEAVAARELVLGRNLESSEIKSLYEQLIDGEILYREAIAHGLVSDAKIREHLVERMVTELEGPHKLAELRKKYRVVGPTSELHEKLANGEL